MLQSVTWSEYLTAVLVVLAIYYLIIGFRFYRKETGALLSGKWKSGRRGSADADEREQSDKERGDDSFAELEAVVLDLRSNVLEQAGRGVGKAELLAQLKQRLSDYAGLRKSAYRIAVNNYIIQHAKEICGVAYSEDELEVAWQGLPR